MTRLDEALEALEDAWESQPAGTHERFGITTTLRARKHRCGLKYLAVEFGWQNFLTGRFRFLARAGTERESLEIAAALVDRLAALRGKKSRKVAA